MHFSSNPCLVATVGLLYLAVTAASSGSTERVVILFGWANGNIKHVLKYAALYAGAGTTVLTATGTSDIFSPALAARQAQRALEWVAANAPQAPFLVGCFSNGGLRCYLETLKLLDSARFAALAPKFRGLIADS